MANWLRQHSWQLGAGALVLAGAVVGIFLIRNAPLEANPGMPEAQRAYWSWVGTINQGTAAALESGTQLLETHPHLRLLYLRLAEVCLEADAVDTCRAALHRVTPPDTLTHLYREAALARLLGPDLNDEAIERWKQVAQDPAIDPTLARLIVDLGFRDEGNTWLGEVEAAWKQQHTADSTALGAAFGLGYAAVLRSQWSIGEHLLTPLVTLAPDDPQAYRELGRIYFFTRQIDKLVAVLEAGIAAAKAQHNLEQELTLQGNLGWTLVRNEGDLEKAERFLLGALEQSRTLSRGFTEGINLQRLAIIYLTQHRYDKALAAVDSAEVLFREHNPTRILEVLNHRSEILSQMYRFSDAEAVLRTMIAEADRLDSRRSKLLALGPLARLRFRMGRFTAAREAATEALALARQDSLRQYQMVSLSTLGRAERSMGNFEAAVDHFQEALAIAEEIKDDQEYRLLTESLGRTALDVQDANTAKGYFDLMLARLQEAGVSWRLVEAYEGLGRTYHQFGNTAEALRYYDLALTHLDAEVEARIDRRAEVMAAKALTLITARSYDEAAALLEEAEGMAAENKSLAYRIQVRLGGLHLSQGLYQEALRYFHQAEAIEQELPRPTLYWGVLFGKALSHWRLGELRQAEGVFREAIAVIETLRENLNSSTNRAYYVQDKVTVYESFAIFLEEQGRTEEALYYTERARSRSLLDLLYTTQQGQDVDQNRPTDGLIEMNRRMQALTEVFSEGDLDAEPEPAVYTTTRAAQLRREYARADSIYRQLRGDLGSEKRIYTFDPLPPATVRGMLQDTEALLVYDLRSTDRPNSVVYVMLPDTVFVKRLGVDVDQLAEAVRFFRDQLDLGEGDAEARWEPGARRLYRDLVAPVLDLLPASVEHLHLIPEGVLHYLPFAALQDEDGRFLVERYTLSVAPSASILKLSRDRNPRRWRSVLLFANPNGRLPGSQKEVEAIASAGSAKRRHVLIGPEATEEKLEQFAGDYDILHFATHGRFVARNPWQSHLELHGDDILSVEEIGHLDLDTYLVTLSACESALSSGLLADVPNGDEWVGLNQAFLAAGTPTVMASLWPIDDRVSSDFMTQFYGVLGPEGKAQALATVQRHFIDNPRTRHPFYWAPFSLIGDPL